MNIQIMNNKCFETLCYVRARPTNEKQILFEYFFDRMFHEYFYHNI